MENKVIAVVDGREVRQSDYDVLYNNLGKNAAYFQGEQGKKTLIDELVMHELIYSEAIDKNYENDQEFIAVINNMKKSLLQQYGLSKVMNSVTVSEEDIKEYYERNKRIYKTKEAVRASHILVDTEEKAHEILEDITDGLKFEDAAEQFSSCPSKQAGGDLGQFGRGQMVPEFEEAVFAMQKGEISEPVKTQFGYHIIKLVEYIPERDSSLEEVKDEVRNKCLAEKQDKAYKNKREELKKLYKVEIFE